MMKSLARIEDAAPILFVAAWATAETKSGAGAAQSVLSKYADIAEAAYSDTLAAAKVLQGSIETLISQPTDANRQAARGA